MSLINELDEILFNNNHNNNDSTDTITGGNDADDIISLLLIKWCERMEEEILNPSSIENDVTNYNNETIQRVSNKLLLLFFYTISEFIQLNSNKVMVSKTTTATSILSFLNDEALYRNDIDEIYVEEQSKKIISFLKDETNGDSAISSSTTTSTTKSSSSSSSIGNYLDIVLRTCQDFIRWYIQFHDPSIQSTISSTNYIRYWKYRTVLELYYRLIVHLSTKYPSYGRYVCQIFFYTTYCPTEDSQLISSYEYLCCSTNDDCNLLQGLLQVLVQTDKYDTKLQLSITKILHNSLVSFPSIVSSTTINAVSIIPDNNNFSDWVTTTRNDTSPISIPSVLWDLVRLYVRPKATGSTDGPSTIIFPGPKESRQSELVIEILRAFYAMKIGSTLSDNNNNNDDGGISTSTNSSNNYETIIVDIFRLDPSDPQCYECQLCCLQLLMDIPTNVGLSIIRTIYKESLSEGAAVDNDKQHKVISFFYILDQQLSQLIEKSHGMMRNDIVASLTASIIPILACLTKYCKADDTVLTIVHTNIFPYSETYEQLVAKELKNSPNGKPKNMKPLDAPPNTIRWKLIQAMIWPYHNIVKRFAGELLWTLCHEDSIEFTLRTGLGNALPYLGMKGLANLPIS